jgi:putative phosphoribosyl transferase
MTLFRNRTDAGQQLAKKLSGYVNRADVVVLGLPRGGVPVAFEVAQALQAPLDVFLVRKLGVPGNEELAMGAIASGGIRVVNEDVVRWRNISEREIETVTAGEQRELERRERLYRGNRPMPELRNRTVIVVDDGLATGTSMRAAVKALRAYQPARIIVAVPTAPREACEEFRGLVDEVLCATTPEAFWAVGAWYEDFTQTTDEEVCLLLEKATGKLVA